jgi:cellobiose phosphorylase
MENPGKYNIYFPLLNSHGTLLSAISPRLAGDIKSDNEHFLNLPVSVEDLRSSLLARREFFIKTSNEILRLSQPANDKLQAGLFYQKMFKQYKQLHAEIINFIPHNLNAEVMWIKIKNSGKKPIKIRPTSFVPLYGRSEKNLRDHRHVSALLNRVFLNRYGILLKPSMVFDESGHSLNETCYFCYGFEGKNTAPQGQFPTLDYFYGSADIENPDALFKEVKPVKTKRPEFDGKEACAALRFADKTIYPGQETDYFLVMGITSDEPAMKKVFAQLNCREKIEKSFSATKLFWQDYFSSINFKFNNPYFDGWLIWVKTQPVLRKLFGCSFLPHFDYGKGGRGWRDLWQDVLALLLTEPAAAKNILLNNFKGVRLDGSNATIINRDGNFIGDRNRISRVWMDHGVWPYLTLKFYINRTVDTNILFQDTVYFHDQQLKRAKEIERNFSQPDFIQRTADGKYYQGSVLEHLLIQNIVQFFNVGEHNIVKLENADWNDGLDMAVDKGESAAFSFMYAHNLKDLCVFLDKIKGQIKTVSLLKQIVLLLDRKTNPINYSDYQQKQKRLNEYFEAIRNISGEKVSVRIEDLISDLQAKAEHLSNWLSEKEWLAEGFFNGYYDNTGKRVEGKYDGKINMMLTAQVFAIMSETASAQQIKYCWKAIKKYLYDKSSGGFKLNTDFGRSYPDLGRAFGFSYGDKENGAVFSHMCAMLANALYKRGFIRQGFEVFNSLFKMAIAEKSCLPAVLPEYFNRQAKGLYLYLTGSASWYIYTLIEEVLGIKFIFGDLVLAPKLVKENFSGKDIGISCVFEDKKLTVNFIANGRPNRAYILDKVFLNGKEVECCRNQCLIAGALLRRQSAEQIKLKVWLK